MGKKKHRRPRPAGSDSPVFAAMHGQQFRLAQEPNTYLWTKFGALAAEGTDTEDPEAARVMLKLVQSCLAPADFRRFDRLCEDVPTSGDDLLAFIEAAAGAWSVRPTTRPSDSSDGPQSTPEKSTDDLSLRVMQRELDKGRPDLAYQVHLAQQGQRPLKAV